MIVKLPMNRQVIEYIQGQHGCDPIRFDAKNHIALQLYSLFRARRKTDSNVPCGVHHMEVCVPGLFIQQGRTYIGHSEIKVFEDIVRLQFEERIIETIYERICNQSTPTKRVKFKQAIEYAHAKFGLSYEIMPYQTLWKRVQRHRQRLESLEA